MRSYSFTDTLRALQVCVMSMARQIADALGSYSVSWDSFQRDTVKYFSQIRKNYVLWTQLDGIEETELDRDEVPPYYDSYYT